MWSPGESRGHSGSGLLYRSQLTDAQLSALVAYKNRGVDLSVTYRYVLSPLYDVLLRLVPRRAAPNLVTLTGFLLAFAGHLAVLWHAPTLCERVPRWASACAAAGLLLYMVLDNLDGRQARRTRSSSPLGHLFDHGCDALNVTLSGMAFAATLRLGPRAGLALVLCGQITLVAATLEELFTGAMVLRVINGPNEGILIIVCTQLAAAVGGSALWARPVALPHAVPLPRAWTATTGRCAMLTGGTAGLLAAAASLAAVARHVRPRRAAALCATRAAPFAAYACAYGLWARAAPELFAQSARTALWTSALFVFDLVSRVILVHLTGSAPFPFLPPLLPCVLLPPAVALAAARWPALAPMAAPCAAVALAVALALAAWRAACIVEQLCDFLNVHCLCLGARYKMRSPNGKVADATAFAPLGETKEKGE